MYSFVYTINLIKVSKFMRLIIDKSHNLVYNLWDFGDIYEKEFWLFKTRK